MEWKVIYYALGKSLPGPLINKLGKVALTVYNTEHKTIYTDL